MKLALEEINGRCDLLPGYRLVVDYANSACSSIPATYHLIIQTNPSQPIKLMILGPACSGAVQLMGEVAQKFMHIPQVAYTASSSLFGIDKKSYPRFYRMVPVTEQLADGYIGLVKKLNWKRVAVVSYDSEELYQNVGLRTAELLTNKRVLAHLSLTDDPSRIVSALKELNARIIIAWIPHSVAIRFWCEVIKENLAGPDFVWFFPGWYRAKWWAAVDGIDCTAEEMRKALEHSVGALGHSVLDNDLSRVLVSKKTVSQFKQDLDAKIAQGTVKTDIFLNYGFVYDAAWTIALALNSSISILKKKGLGRLEDFTYERVDISDVFTKAIQKTTFQGISGRVLFQKNGNRINPLIGIIQYRDGVAVPVTVYDPSSNSFINLPGKSIKWRGGYVPKDAPSPELQKDSMFEIIIVVVVTSLGILSTIYFLIFNIYYRNNLIVKRSSYRLNTIILIGVLVGFVGTLLHVIQLDYSMSGTSAALVCNIRNWMTEIAFVVCFSTLAVKIWRLYKVFFNKNLAERKYLEDRHLMPMIAGLVSPTVLVLIIQAVTFPITLHSYAEINEDNLAQERIFYTCRGKHYLIFSVILFIGGVILGLVSLVLAFETKKHLPTDKKYAKYHESAVINLTTMLAILLSSICDAVVLLFQLNNIRTGILLIITLSECLWLYPVSYLLFAPKVYRVYQGILQPHKRTLLAQGVSVISRRFSVGTVLSRKRTYDVTGQSNRKKGSSVASTISDSSRSSSTDSIELSEGELTQRNAHRRVTFSVRPDLTIDEVNEIEDYDVFDEVNETKNDDVIDEVNEMEDDDVIDEVNEMEDDDVGCVVITNVEVINEMEKDETAMNNDSSNPTTDDQSDD